MLLTSVERKGAALEFNYVCFDHLHGHHHYRLLNLDHGSSELQYDGHALKVPGCLKRMATLREGC